MPFSYLLMATLFVVIITVVLAGIWTNYETSWSNLVSNADRLRQIGESHIDQHCRMIHTGLKIYDSTSNDQMEHAFAATMAEYNRTRGDPSRMDLEGLKKEIGGMEISVVNESYWVAYSTSPAERGLDLAAVSPDLVVYLRAIRNRSGFFPDRMAQDEATGRMTRVGYMATPDQRNIIKLELSSDRISEERMELQYSDVDDEIRSINPYIDSVRLFTSRKRLINDASYTPTPEESAMLDYLLWENRTSQVFHDPASQRTVVWEVVDMRDPDYVSDMSIFAQIVYSDARLAGEGGALASAHAVVALLVLLTGGLLAVTVTRRISRPLAQLVEDVDAVARGDLDHGIRPVAWYEFSTLADKTGVMVERLREQIRQREASEQRFMDIVQFLPLGVYEADRHGTLTFANPAALEVFGLSPLDVERGLNIFSVISDGDVARAKASFSAILKGDRSRGTELVARRTDGRTVPILAYTVAWTEDGAVVGVRGSVVDIGRLKEVETEIRRLNAELEMRVGQRTHELEAFTYSVSHDLRAPLRAIDGYIAILSKEVGPELGDRDRHYIAEVRQTVRQMSDLIDGLLALSRLDRQELVREDVHPMPLVMEVVAVALEQQAAPTIEITAGGLPPCSADRAMLRQVYANLVGNAVKFSRDRDEARIEIGATVQNGETVYHVRDNGVGFDMENAERLFQPFQRLHRSDQFEGSGIGLATVERIVRRHGGRIWAESVPAQGSTFSFVIPGP